MAAQIWSLPFADRRYPLVVFLVITAFTLVAVGALGSVGPLCCADNVYNSIAAKNLAAGYAYSSTFPGNVYSLVGYDSREIAYMPFDPGVSTGGPTQALSVALFWLFPDSLFAADIAGIMTRTLGLILIAWVFPMRGVLGSWIFGCMVVALVAVANYTPAVYMTAIGDLTSAIFLVAGTTLLITGRDQNWRVATGVAILYFAFLTKLNSVVFIAPVVLMMLAYSVWQRCFRSVIAILATGTLLVLCTEFCLLAVLGVDGYVINKQALILFVQGVAGGSGRAGLAKFIASGAIHLPLLAAAVGTALTVCFVGRFSHTSRLLGLALLIATAFLAYNLRPAAANIRYVILPASTIVGLTAILASQLVREASNRKRLAFIFAGAGGGILLLTGMTGQDPLWAVNHASAALTSSGYKVAEVQAYRAQISRLRDAPIVSHSWTNAVEAEYLSDTPGLVQSLNSIGEAGYYLLVDSRWTPAEQLREARQSCVESFGDTYRQILDCRNAARR